MQQIGDFFNIQYSIVKRFHKVGRSRFLCKKTMLIFSYESILPEIMK